MKELNWIALARAQIGVEEVKGSEHNPVILSWLDEMGWFSGESKAWWKDDETPWCGLFVAWILGKSGRHVVHEWYRAKEWKEPTPLLSPAYGCLAVYDRKGGGHVGFVVGKDQNGRVMVLGGNQGDKVSIVPFAPDRDVTYHWPSWWIDGAPLLSRPNAGRFDLPLLNSDGRVSSNET